MGETFSGVDFDRGVAAAREFAALLPGEAAAFGLSTAQVALAWVAQLDGVSAVIPGARNVEQAESNAAAGSMPRLSSEFTAAVTELYDREFRVAVHDRW